MERGNDNKKQVSNINDTNKIKERRGDTERSSSQGRKAASGGFKETNNRGHRKGV